MKIQADSYFSSLFFPHGANNFFVGSHLPFVRQTRLELFACILRVLDVNELFMDWCGIIKCGLLASIYTGHRSPNANSPSEVISHIQGHHVFDAQTEICRAFDLTAEKM